METCMHGTTLNYPCKKCEKKEKEASPVQRGVSLRDDLEREFRKEEKDITESRGYSDTYKTGIQEGLRLARIIYDEIVAKRKASER
ncbi:MAG: hypothetical protein KAR20_06865 [Candidatus Heimdallarchaeota archaeon]|nr:hypothetical protein [Candidatus Heimdallarchaeota archaeon]